MKLTTDTKHTVYLEDIPVGRLVDEGIDQVFYVPGDGGFCQHLLPLNGLHFSNINSIEKIDAIIALHKILER